MSLNTLRNELYDFYLNKLSAKVDAFVEKVLPVLDERSTPEMTGFQRKALQYRTITEYCEPVLFHNSPFYHELGMIPALSDGASPFRGMFHAGGWNYRRSNHMFDEQDPQLTKYRQAQGEENLYLICGPFCNTRQHFYFNCKKIYTGGLKCLYDEAQSQMEYASDAELDFLKAACEGLLCMKTIAEKFARKADELIAQAQNAEEIKNLQRIRDAAAHTPWNAPRSFYEALNLHMFTRTIPGALEGVGYNSFGRLDAELYPFYERDLTEGRITKEEAYELISAFLLTWDCHYDHDMKMIGYSDHELENTYTLGGCDEEGKPVFNDLTRMFIKATREHKILYPKIIARFSDQSPSEYLQEISQDVVKGTAAMLYQNDNASIAALERCGISPKDARDYLITGCWSMIPNGNHMDDHGNYVNLLKAFEWSIHMPKEKMDKCGMHFKPIECAKDFEEVYRITMNNIEMLFRERHRMTMKGKGIWPRVDPQPLTSSTLDNCLANRKDLSDGGCKYHHEHYLCVGLPNIVDSFLAIKKLCFDEKKYTLPEFLHAVRANWEGYESMRQEALQCPCWGDGEEESCSLANRFNNDLYAALQKLPTFWSGGTIRLGHLTYTEIRWWGEKTLATPDGRRSGDYFSQGLTPSRLRKIKSIAAVINSFDALDGSTMAGNAVLNIILPTTRMTTDICEAYLRAMANTSIECLQMNCCTKEELLDAQIHPENHRDLILRVCGFSARFTSLSPDWQKEILSRNFYE